MKYFCLWSISIVTGEKCVACRRDCGGWAGAGRRVFAEYCPWQEQEQEHSWHWHHTAHGHTPHLDTGDLMPPATPGLSWEVSMRAEQLVAAARPPSHHWSQQTSLTTLHSSLHHTAAAAATNPRHCYGAGPGDVMSDAGIIPTFTHLYCSYF